MRFRSSSLETVFVETEKHRALLAQAGCDLFQGFLVSPAVSPEAFLKLLEEDSS